MAIQFVGKQEAAGTTVTIPTHQTGDLILIFAYRDGSTTAPTVPSSPSYSTIGTSNGANTNSSSFGYRIATSNSETSGTWTNANHLVCQVYRYAAGLGPNGNTGGSGTTVTYPAIAMEITDGTSWVAGFAGHRSTNTNLQNAPSLMTNRSTLADATCETAGHDTNGGVSSWSATNVSVGGTTSGWRARTVEIQAARASGTIARTLDAFTSAASGGQTFTGTSSVTLGDFVSTADGTHTPPAVPVDGSIAVTLSAFTSSASGSETFTGTVGVTLSAITSSASGAETLTGTVAQTLSSFTSSATGTQTLTGTIGITLDAFTPSASGSEVFTGTAAPTLSTFTSSASGAQSLSGTVAVTLDALQSSASGTAGSTTTTGTIAVTLGAFASDASGTETISGSASPTLSSFTSTASGSQAFAGSAASSLSSFTSSVAGSLVFTGSIAETLNAFTAAADGSSYTGMTGTVAATLGPFVPNITGQHLQYIADSPAFTPVAKRSAFAPTATVQAATISANKTSSGSFTAEG